MASQQSYDRWLWLGVSIGILFGCRFTVRQLRKLGEEQRERKQGAEDADKIERQRAKRNTLSDKIPLETLHVLTKHPDLEVRNTAAGIFARRYAARPGQLFSLQKFIFNVDALSRLNAFNALRFLAYHGVPTPWSPECDTAAIENLESTMNRQSPERLKRYAEHLATFTKATFFTLDERVIHVTNDVTGHFDRKTFYVFIRLSASGERDLRDEEQFVAFAHDPFSARSNVVTRRSRTSEAYAQARSRPRLRASEIDNAPSTSEDAGERTADANADEDAGDRQSTPPIADDPLFALPPFDFSPEYYADLWSNLTVYGSPLLISALRALTAEMAENILGSEQLAQIGCPRVRLVAYSAQRRSQRFLCTTVRDLSRLAQFPVEDPSGVSGDSLQRQRPARLLLTTLCHFTHYDVTPLFVAYLTDEEHIPVRWHEDHPGEVPSWDQYGPWDVQVENLEAWRPSRNTFSALTDSEASNVRAIWQRHDLDASEPGVYLVHPYRQIEGGREEARRRTRRREAVVIEGDREGEGLVRYPPS